MDASKGVVLIVDDVNGTATRRLLADSIETIVRHPNDVTAADLKKSKLVLVDFKLEDWPERDNQQTPSLRPQDGISLIAVLRSNIANLKAAPTAFALNSGMLRDLSNGGDWIGREHAIARSIDLEWVFAKGSRREGFAASVKALAGAVAALPTKWPVTSKTKEKIFSLLAIPSKARWRQSAIEAVDRSYPPHEILIKNSSGIALLRWLLHVVIPYPTFLLDQRYLAARLQVEPRSFAKLLSGPDSRKIRKLLEPFEYRGILSDFSGVRWWRAGIEYWLWDKTNGNSFDRDAIEQLVRSKISSRVEFSLLSSPVVSLDDQLRASDNLVSLQEAIEIKPDGWPSFADSAWIPGDLIKDPAFIALVPQSEKNKI